MALFRHSLVPDSAFYCGIYLSMPFFNCSLCWLGMVSELKILKQACNSCSNSVEFDFRKGMTSNF